MNKTRLRVLEDILVSREKIKSEDSSLRVENTTEDLRASITRIESNKIEQGTSSRGKNITPTSKEFWESGHYDLNGNKSAYATRMRLIDYLEVEENTEYFTTNQTYILRGYDKDKNFIQNIGVIHSNASFTTDENVIYLGISIDKTLDEYDEETDQVMICKNSEIDKIWVKGYVDMPSLRYKSLVEGITGDVNLKVQNKNLIGLGTLINGFTDLQSGRFRADNNSISYYFETAKLPKTITTSGENVNRSNVSYYNKIPKLDVQSENWDSKNHMEVSQTILVDKQYKYILIQFTYNQQANDIQLEEGNQATKYMEHQEKNFTISLGDKTLYKGDRIVRKNRKWYFDLKWAVINDFINLIKNSTVDGLFRASLELSDKIINTSYLNFNQGYSNILNTVGNGATYNKVEGFTVAKLNGRGNPILWIYIKEFENYTQEEYQQALKDLNAYFIIPLQENDLELIEDETLISQLDAILTNIFEYDDVTNFDFDNDVVFEINVEKDNIKLQRAELKKEIENMKNEITTASALALESEV